MSKRHWILLFLGGVLAGLGAIYTMWPKTASEVTDFVLHSGTRKLRSELRPIRRSPHLLVLAFDGVGRHEFLRAVNSASMPHVTALLGEQRAPGVFAHGYHPPGALSILPSTTMAAWASVYTGEPVSRTGVSGNEWFVREDARFFAPAPVSVKGDSDSLRMLKDGLVGNAIRVPTLYELLDLRSHVSLAPVYRGADVFSAPGIDEVVDLFAGVARGLAGDDEIQQEIYEELDVSSVENALQAIKDYGLPNLQVVSFPGIDLFSHMSANPLEMQVRYLSRVLDPAIGRLLDAYRQAGVLEETWVIFVSDHGHTPVIHDDAHSLSVGESDEPTALLESAGFRVRASNLRLDENQLDFQAVVAFQGAMAYIYLADRSICPEPGDRCDWNRPPRYEQDVLPLLRAIHDANRHGRHLPQLRGTVELILSREPALSGKPARPMRVFDGNALADVSEYLSKHPHPELLDFAGRMRDLSAGPYGNRAGDILLLAHSGMHLPVERRFYFANLHRSWHGSPSAQDSEIIFMVASPSQSGERIRDFVNSSTGKPASHLDVVPLLMRLAKSASR